MFQLSGFYLASAVVPHVTILGNLPDLARPDSERRLNEQLTHSKAYITTAGRSYYRKQ